MSVPKKTLSADGCEVEVRTARGIVYLHFIQTIRGVWCTARSTYSRGCPTQLPRSIFMNARELAFKRMNEIKIAEQQVFQKKDGLSSEGIARAVLENARQGDLSIGTALNIFMKSATWCDPSRRPAIMSEIGKIGGTASKRRAGQRQRRKIREEQAARQGDLFT